MAINQLLIKNLTNAPLPVQAVFERNRQFSQIIGVGKTVDIGATATPDEVSRSSEIQNLITKGKISFTWIQGTSDLTPLPGIEDLQGKSTSQTIRFPFVAGAGAAADDVIIYNANSPRIRIIDTFIMVSSAVAASTAQLRSGLAGGGSTLSDSMATTATGVVRNIAQTTSVSLPAGSTLVLRRSASATRAGGEVVIEVDNS
jgi:hypothetical protein